MLKEQMKGLHKLMKGPKNMPNLQNIQNLQELNLDEDNMFEFG